MSGGGGGGTSSDEWRVGGGATGDDKCAITERTVLNSPNPVVIKGLHAGDVLEVELITTPKNRLVAKTTNGDTAGAVTSTRMVDIIECIQDGSVYEAEVLSINAGKVDIEIRLT